MFFLLDGDRFSPIMLDRVSETTTTTGTGSYALGGVVSAGFRPFADAGDQRLVVYCVENAAKTRAEWGLGKYVASSNTLERTTIIKNHLGTTAAVNWEAGAKNIFSCDTQKLWDYLHYNSSLNLEGMTLEESAGMDTPPSGFGSLYVLNDGHVYFKNDAGTQFDLTDTAGTNVLAQSVALPGDLTPAQITADQNNYDPTSLSTASTLRLSSNASRNITGLAGGADGRLLLIHNVGSFSIVLKDESSSSTAANRFALSADLTMTGDQSVLLQYDSASSRWRALSIPPSSGSGAPSSASYLVLAADASLTSERVLTAGTNVVVTDAGAGGNYTLNVMTQNVALPGVISPAQILGQQDNYSPSGLSTASTLRLTSDGSRDITGLAGGSNGQLLLVHNVGANAIVLKDESSSSTAANRFALAGDLTLSGDQSVPLQYDSTSSRWRALSTPPVAGSGAPAGASYLVLGTDATLTAERVLTAGDNIKFVDFGAGGNLEVNACEESVAFRGQNTTTQITSDQNDYNPTGLSTTSMLRLSTDASRQITGLAGGSLGRLMTFHNVGVNPIVLKDESSSSTATNRFALSGDLTLSADQAVMLQYDATSDRWRALGTAAVAGGSGAPSSASYLVLGSDPTLTAERVFTAGANVKVTDAGVGGAFTVAALTESVALPGDISPGELLSNQDNYSPSGLSTASTLRLTCGGSRDITGLAGGSDGRLLLIHNVGTSPIVLKDESPSSTAGNRFALSADLTLNGDESVMLQYDSTSSRWRALSTPASSVSGAPTGASYLVLGTHATLTAERVLTAGVNLKITDAGAGGNLTLDVLTESVALTGDISPAQITSNQNDYSPTGLSTASTLRLSSDASRDITGLAGGSDGRLLVLHNVGAQPIILRDSSGSSTAANRFALSADVTLLTDQSLMLQYDSTTARWRAVCTPAPGTTGAPAGASYLVLGTDATLTSERVLTAGANVKLSDAGAGGALTLDVLTESVAFTGDISPSQITANQNDYSPTGLSTASTLRLTSDASRDITGLAGGSDGRIIVIHNVGTQPIVLRDNSASSSAANRFQLAGDMTLSEAQSVVLQYDSTSSVWRPLSTSSGSAAPVGASYLVVGADATLTAERVLTAGSNVKFTDAGAGGAFTVAALTESVALPGDISPGELLSNQDDYSPTGLSTASTLRLTCGGSRDITGLAGGSDGRLLLIHNVGTSPIVLKDESPSSTAGNRFALSADLTLNGDQSVLIQYDSTSSRWRALTTPAGGSGAPTGASYLVLGTDATLTAERVLTAGANLKITDAGAGGNLTLDVLTESVALPGDISPSQITSNQNDYSPTGLSTASTLRLSSDASRDITGLAGGTDGRVIVVHNVGAQPIILRDSSGSSTAANRFALSADVTLLTDQSLMLQYDNTTQRWRAVCTPAPGTTGAPAGASYLVLGTDATLTAERVLTAGSNVKLTDAGAGGALTVAALTESVALTGDISDTPFGDQDNYNPSGLSTASTLRLSTTGTTQIHGLAGGSDGRLILIHNVGANAIILKDEHGMATASNRFALSADLTLNADQSALLQYDGTSLRWRAVSAPGASSGGAPTGASYLVLDNDATLTDERRLTAGTNVKVTDGGAGTYLNLSVLTENVALPGDISPAQITSNQNDYSPSGLLTASTLRLTSDASREITGLDGGTDGRLMLVHNVGSNPIVLKDDSASSTASNRFALNADVTLSADHCAILQYDSTSTRWRCVASSIQGAGGGGANTALSNLGSVAINTGLAADADATYALGSTGARWRDVYSTTVRTGTADTNTLKLQAYDVDGATWTNFITLTAGNTPTCDLSTSATIGGAAIVSTSGTQTLTNKTLTSPTLNGTTIASERVDFSGDISPTQISANQNNYDPSGLATSSTLRLSSDATRNITGLAGGADGRLLLMHNVGSNDIVLKDESASSTASNRFALNADVTLGADHAAMLQYDSTSSRWRCVASSIEGAGGGGANTALSNLSSVAINSGLVAASDITYALGSTANRWKDLYSATVRTGTADADTLKLQAYDVDGAAWTNFITLTAGNTPTCDLSTSATIGGAAIVSTSGTQTLTNKTLTSATLSGTTIASERIDFSGDISPAQITADQNDYDPSGLSTASTLRLSTDQTRNLTGLAGGADGRLIVIHNVGSNHLVLKDESSSSTAANRFALSADVTLMAGQSCLLQYDGTSSRYRAVSAPGMGGGGGGGCDVQIFTSSGTWTKPSGAMWVQLLMIAGGGGGGSGRRGGAGFDRYGGGGGSGGSVVQVMIDAANLAATQAVTVGTGGAGGDAKTTDSTSGSAGSAGTNTTFDNYKAAGGNGGSGGTSSSGTAGSAKTGLCYTVSVTGQTPSAGSNGNASSPTNKDAPLTFSGGGGGGVNTSDTHGSGGNGGTISTLFLTTAPSGGTGGAAGGTAGGAGASGAGSDLLYGTGGGGGGGNSAGAGGNGGAGGLYGAGGGGGGASVNGSNSGAGGAGANGVVIIVTHI